jgi:hypothetical protein
VDRGEGRVIHAVGGFQVPDHLQVVLPGAGAFWREGYQHGGRGPGGEDDGLALGEDLGGGLAVDDYAGEVRVDGVCGEHRRLDPERNAEASKAYADLADVASRSAMSAERYSDRVLADVDRLKNEGFELIKLKNLWHANQYKGIPSAGERHQCRAGIRGFRHPLVPGLTLNEEIRELVQRRPNPRRG